MAKRSHQSSSFATAPSELLNIYLNSAFTMTGRLLCNA
jgi:hypothetical protein